MRSLEGTAEAAAPLHLGCFLRRVFLQHHNTSSSRWGCRKACWVDWVATTVLDVGRGKKWIRPIWACSVEEQIGLDQQNLNFTTKKTECMKKPSIHCQLIKWDSVKTHMFVVLSSSLSCCSGRETGSLCCVSLLSRPLCSQPYNCCHCCEGPLGDRMFFGTAL